MAFMSEQEFCIKLVRAIEKYECLYNFKLPDYSRKDIIEQTWNQVAIDVNVDVARCRNKWKNIRTVFMRHLKQGIGKRKQPYYLRNLLQFLIPFLKPATFEISEVTTSNLSSELDHLDIPSHFSNDLGGSEEEDEEIDDNDDNYDEGDDVALTIKQDPSPTLELDQESKRKQRDDSWEDSLPKKKKNEEIQGSCSCQLNREKEEDPKRAFLISLLPDLHSLNEKEMRQFKRKVLGMIDEIIDNRSISAPACQSSTPKKYEFISIYSPQDNNEMSADPNSHITNPL